ncbi:MAG TPA: TIR domain-containing protein [Terriglobia bacterium]|nr:TIR domain-containing protein [Terriglobia bacterium]
MTYTVEEVFRTEGVPEFTYVRPPNFNELLVDIRSPGKPVIIEGQSGTGKTTTTRKIIGELLPHAEFEYLSARKSDDIPKIVGLANGNVKGHFIVDDFHRLKDDIQSQIANLVKLSAEEYGNPELPKVVIIGINKVGSELIHLVHDIAKRCGIHRIKPASRETTNELIEKGEEKLRVLFPDKQRIFEESQGDYWMTQLVCQSICLLNNVTETIEVEKDLPFSLEALRNKVTSRLENSYQEAAKEFCRGKRFRSTNDPYLKLLRCVSQQDSSIVDLTELANANPDVRGSINNIKETRLRILIESKPVCERYFYYNPETKHFAIEDPALSYYLKHLNWDDLRRVCGFRAGDRNYDFDFAISFAGENRQLAKMIAEQLELLDCSVFYDEFFEANYLGKAWHAKLKEVFAEQSRFIVCLLDSNHLEKIWPTFERELFVPRVTEGAVIPIYLDATVFPGVPGDLAGIRFESNADFAEQADGRVTDEITFKLVSRLDDI